MVDRASADVDVNVDLDLDEDMDVDVAGCSEGVRPGDASDNKPATTRHQWQQAQQPRSARNEKCSMMLTAN